MSTSSRDGPPSSTDLDELKKLIRQMASTQLNDDAQEQLGRLQNILNWYGPDIKQRHIDGFVVAATALSGNTPNILLAQVFCGT